MKPFNSLKIFFFFFLLGSVHPGMATATLNVVTTTEDIAAIVKEVGGDRVTVKSIAKGYQDPHAIEAKPSYMLKINRADLLAYQGLDLEVGWLPMLIQGGRNKKVLSGQLGHLNVSQVITPLDVPVGEPDRSLGDVHPQGNPHYHLNPENGLLMAEVIADRLARLDPVNSGVYKINLENFSKRLEDKIIAWKARMAKFKNSQVITYHATWNYLLDFFSIESAGTVENRPGIPPSGRHLAELAAMMKQTNTKIILQAGFFDREYSDLLASKTRGEVVILPAYVGGEKEVRDYIALFDTLVGQLEKVLEKNQSFANHENP